MIGPYRGMYLRPGNLYKQYTVMRKKPVLEKGHTLTKYEPCGMVSGILAQASALQSDQMKHRWDQDQQSLTHTMVCRGKVDLKKGDTLAYEEHYYLVLLTDNVGALSGTTLVYLEERNDLR